MGRAKNPALLIFPLQLKEMKTDLQDEQDGTPLQRALNQRFLSSIFFHPVNPVHPVRFQRFNVIVPAHGLEA
jgi:hypothetical protein